MVASHSPKIRHSLNARSRVKYYHSYMLTRHMRHASEDVQTEPQDRDVSRSLATRRNPRMTAISSARAIPAFNSSTVTSPIRREAPYGKEILIHPTAGDP